MTSTILDESTIPVIRGRFAGDLLEPGDDGYEEARSLFNAMIDRRPRLIVRCTGAADVVAGILLARETGLPLSIKGGGHGVNGHAVCDDGIMLDLSQLKRIDVDPEARVVRAQAGVNWGELDAATQAHGRSHHDDGHRGPHARRRQRLARANVRFHGAQPARGRGGHGRRAHRARER
jgi:FAD binding domain